MQTNHPARARRRTHTRHVTLARDQQPAARPLPARSLRAAHAKRMLGGVLLSVLLLSKAGFEAPPRFEADTARAVVHEGTRACCGPDFTATRGSLHLNGKKLHLKGLSWFGFEGDNAVVDGLWQHSVDSYLDVLVANQFNALRVPLALNNVLNNPVPSKSMLSAEPTFVGEDSLWLLEMIVMRAAQKGILVLLDMHRLNSSLWPDPRGLWYNDHVTLETLKSSWIALAQRFCRHWNVFGADVFNEARDLPVKLLAQPIICCTALLVDCVDMCFAPCDCLCIAPPSPAATRRDMGHWQSRHRLGSRSRSPREHGAARVCSLGRPRRRRRASGPSDSRVLLG
eukprot:353602-Prymnesium_polylepis.4